MLIAYLRRYAYRGRRHRPARGRMRVGQLLAVLALQAGALVPMAVAAPRRRDSTFGSSILAGALILALAYGLALAGMLAP